MNTKENDLFITMFGDLEYLQDEIRDIQWEDRRTEVEAALRARYRPEMFFDDSLPDWEDATEKVEEIIEEKLDEEIHKFYKNEPRPLKDIENDLSVWYNKLEFEHLVIVESIDEIPADSVVSRFENSFITIVGIKDIFETTYYVCFKEIPEARKFVEMHVS